MRRTDAYNLDKWDWANLTNRKIFEFYEIPGLKMIKEKI